MQDKKTLRKKYREIRELVPDKETKSHIIFHKIINLPEYKKAQNIGFYSSFSSEVDTRELIDYSLQQEKHVYLPKISTEHNMNFYRINSLEDLNSLNKYGILEPSSNYIMKNIDLIIIPGICFDINKNRLGFGAGYYDNFLKAHQKITKIGICFDEQILYDDFINATAADIPMDIIISDQNYIS